MSHGHLNPDVPNTAARHLAKALTRVNPVQRAALLRETINLAQAALKIIDADSFDDVRAA